MNKEINETRK